MLYATITATKKAREIMNNHEDNDELLNEFAIQDVAGATLLLLGTLTENYIKEGYCDPMMFRALNTAKKLAGRLATLAIDHQDFHTAKQASNLVTSFQLTIMEAGETINRIIEENNLPVTKNTFECDPTHPNYEEHSHGEEIDFDGEQE